MADTVNSIFIGSVGFYTILAFFVAFVVGGIVYMIVSRKNTLSSGASKEGFQGPMNGVSDIPCAQESAEVVALCEMFANRKSTTDDGAADLKELKRIMSKLCCAKHDLMSPTQVVSSMMYLPYDNAHDRENPADTVARCFTHSVPPRDLDITFGTWKERALLLLNKLCTSYGFSASDAEKAKAHFMAAWMDTFSVAKTVCLTPDEKVSESPRDLSGFTPESLEDLGPYKGYY